MLFLSPFMLKIPSPTYFHSSMLSIPLFPSIFFFHSLYLSSPSTLLPCYVGSLSPQHGASSGCRWRNGLQIWRLAANILNKQSCLQLGGWAWC
jgi:hypothetical protein